jgi:hypothetical protein
MSPQHKEPAGGRWNLLSFAEQMANIGSEIERTISWKKKGRPDISGRAFEGALELLDLTVADPKNRDRLFHLFNSDTDSDADFISGGMSRGI